VELHKSLLMPRSANRVCRDNNPVVFRQPNRASIERLVMQNAQSESIRNFIWAAHVVPHDVRRFDQNWLSIQASVQAAYSASFLIGQEYARSKRRIAPLPPHGQVTEPHRVQNLIMHGLRKVTLKQVFCNFGHQRRILDEQFIQTQRKPPFNIRLKQG